MLTRSLTSTLFILACCAVIDRAGEIQWNEAMASQPPIKDKDAAIAVAVRLTHLDALSHTIAAEEITITNDNTPFLAEQVEKRRAWAVHADSGSLTATLKSAAPGFTDVYAGRRSFTALIDETTGQLLSVRSRFHGVAEEMRPEPSAPSARAQLAGSGEAYRGFPTTEPKITFVDALDIVLSKGIGSPFLAKEIDGLYVMHSRNGEAPRPVWIITLRGLPPLPVEGRGGEQVPAWQRNHIRNVVDAMTGRCLFATGRPQPVEIR